jgi:hypothetical protein
MLILDCEQGSEEWVRLRCGLPTASAFDRIITPKTRKPSAQAFGYLCECLAEIMLDAPLDAASSAWMQRGSEIESEACTWYAMIHDCDVRRVGFVLRDDRCVGCSPDGLVGEDGGLEIKVPGAKKHVEYMLEPERLSHDHYCQSQGGLWITDRKWWDLVSYNPVMEPVVIRVDRDAEFIEALAECVDRFVADLAAARVRFGITQAAYAA